MQKENESNLPKSGKKCQNVAKMATKSQKLNSFGSSPHFNVFCCS